jgi:outer membrane protein OmpA-like peptidoglycan-associated protein
MHLAANILFAAALIAALPTGGAHAQGNPSADQIINSLKPSTGMLGGTRGIRPVTPETPAAEPAPPARPHSSAPAPQVATTTAPHAPPPPPPAPSVNLTVQFATNSAVLTPAAVKTLSELGRALSSSALASYRFRIEGHTDTVGQPDANKALSERRAQAVVEFLTTSFKIDPSRLEAVGMGEDGLVVQTPPNTPEPRNRRVQVINLGA